ncbi:hypothetical protein P3X46_024622 [Hevea brasiliensis]|uniref:Zinc finger CCCH domain-containing protein 5 n=1 Tax=Hevea brasiliensis TaxID=3981 RepID=A0ABQ9L6M1_HEVBR|nr:hypothetical protein P3X46_024622 [Hevea brasiliensis]
MSRKEKRKERKKMKRKQFRREIAEKEREDEERKMNDPEEQRRAEEMEEEERQRMESERKEFEESERGSGWKRWKGRVRRRKKKRKGGRPWKRKSLRDCRKDPESRKIILSLVEKENECDEDDDWEYVEEGPAEIIWQGNEIIVRKKRVRVPKKSADQQNGNEDSDRPISNPLPPQSEAFAEYQNASMTSADQILDNVAQQIPNFGTEQDKAHCPFHLKTGACRFGQRCSRVHFYPDKACTLLMKNMYNGPGLSWEQDEGLEYTDEEVEHCYEEFYEDVHTEFLKYGEIVNFKVCKNGSFHLRGNVYVQYKSLDSAVLAYHSINGRYFAGKQVKCEFVNVTRWKVAICGDYMKSRLKTCSHGTACNFIHCFRNPGGDYEWADRDKPPPRYWVKKMAALFGYSDKSKYRLDKEKFEHTRTSSKTIPADTDRHRARSRSRDIDHLLPYSGKSSDSEDRVQQGARWHRCADDDWKQIRNLDEKSCEKDYYNSDHRNHDSDSDGSWSDRDINLDRKQNKNGSHVRKRSKDHGEVSECSTDRFSGKSKQRIHEADSNEWSGRSRKRKTHQVHTKSSEICEKEALLDDNRERKNESHAMDGYRLDRDRDGEKHHRGRSSRHQSKVRSTDYRGDVNLGTGSVEDLSYRDKNKGRHDHPARKSSRHKSNFSDFTDDHWDDRYRTYDSDSNDEWLDKERHHSHKRRRSKKIEQEISDEEGRTAKRLKEKSYCEEIEMGKSHLKRNPLDCPSSRRSYSGRESNETNSHEESLNSRKIVDPCNGRYMFDHDSRYKSIKEINEQDRWKPESPDRDGNSTTKSVSVRSYDSGSPGRYDGSSN